jgi:hypothetical protein
MCMSQVKRIVKESKGPDMKLPPDLHEGIARAVAEGISYHAIIRWDERRPRRPTDALIF